jgi:GxxExxY protein
MHDGLHASLTEQIIGCAMEVHRHLGPGLLESIYESALCFELRTAGVVFKRQIGVPLFYKGMLRSEHRPDLVVAEAVIVEVKAVERLGRDSHGANADLLARDRSSHRFDSQLQQCSTQARSSQSNPVSCDSVFSVSLWPLDGTEVCKR